jgi:transposase-like protein
MARKSKISAEKKAAIIRAVEGGASVSATAAKYKVSAPAVYLWVRAKNGGMKKAAREGGPAGDGATLSPIVEEIALGRKFKEFIESLGYVKR